MFNFNLQLFAEDAVITNDDISTALSGLENGDAYVSAFKNAISEGSKASGELTKLRTQVTRLTNDQKKITGERDAALANFNKLMDFNGIPVDTEDLDSAIEGLRVKQGQDNSAELAVLQSKNNELTRKMAQLQSEMDGHKKTAEERLARIHSDLRNRAVETALEKSGALEPKTLVPIFQNQVTIGDDETPIFTTADGNQVTVEEGVKLFFEQHPRLLANNQNAGAGSNGGAPKKVDLNNISQEEYVKLRNEGKI